jgi:predicted GIY-YIG superfamily endonuclease
MKGTIYLLHFSQPFGHAKHYTGYTRDLSTRLESHARGTGARLLEVVTQAGITFQLARTWIGTRKGERRLKNRGGASRICPLCNPKAMNRAKAI